MGFDDIEVVSFSANAGVQASNLSGTTGFQGGDEQEFEGLELVDYDEIVDRNEELRLLYVAHALSVYANSTETEDGTVAASVEISADPSLTDVGRGATDLGTGSVPGTGKDSADVVGLARSDDTIDIIGRALTAVGTGAFSDTTNGTGGGGAAGHDSYDSEVFPMEMGRFHPRDELFLNGRFASWNIDDAGIHIGVEGQHIYGVMES